MKYKDNISLHNVTNHTVMNPNENDLEHIPEK